MEREQLEALHHLRNKLVNALGKCKSGDLSTTHELVTSLISSAPDERRSIISENWDHRIGDKVEPILLQIEALESQFID